MKKLSALLGLLLGVLYAYAAEPFITFKKTEGAFPVVGNGQPCTILVDKNENSAILIAVKNLQEDFLRVTGKKAETVNTPSDGRYILVGSIESPFIKQLFKAGKLNRKDLEGKNEKYVIQTVDQPLEGVEQALVIAGSDRRGTVYGIYELSRQMGVSPWYWWMDVPVTRQTEVYAQAGVYTDGEPAVTYRGIFLNDEAPCLTTWVKNTYGTNYGDHRFYARVFELILRLKGNFMWPAMWGWAFYADDPENSKTADEMGIIMGTSHHEPMARNHQEYARNREKYGAWNYETNPEGLNRFFREGIERMKDTEDVVTIGMRGDGDAAMGGEEGKDHEYVPQFERNKRLMETIFKNQRRIIKDVTGRPAEETPQVWALYKEVLEYYDRGLRVPEDVIMLLCDDNWGNVRRLPNAEERKHPGGWGMYYHVDYVGAPRNSKWINATPIQNMWEQLQLTYEYGVDKLWVLNVGDLKPMEYPITLFLDMAWNPQAYHAGTLLHHTYDFCRQAFGDTQAEEAARILNLCCKYNGRSTAEMLDHTVYNLETGEWRQVVGDYAQLEAEALRQYISLKPEYRDAYKQLILFPVQAMANLHEMYYAQAMNLKLYAEGNPEANAWADKVEKAFARDKQLCDDYNHAMSGGKWNGMMIQKHIGYTNWSDNFPADKLPEIHRIGNPEAATGGYLFTGKDGYVAMEAEHYFACTDAGEAKWTVIPYMGRTLSGMSLMPYTVPANGASLSYKLNIPEKADSVTVHVIVKSTLAFHTPEGHKYSIGFEGGQEETVNFNRDLNEDPENIYTVYYPTIARRVVEKQVRLKLPVSADGTYTLNFRPLDPGIVLEKIVVDYGGYQPAYLFGNESPCRRK